MASGRDGRRLFAVAHHEAGHAVAALHYHQPFRYVTVRPNEDSLGHLLHHEYPAWFTPDIESTPRIRERLEGRIITSFAGGLAERRFLARRRVSTGSWHDHHIAVDLASHLAGSDRSLHCYVDWLWAVAEDFVSCPPFWDQIQKVAHELADRGRLSANEVRNVLN